MKIFKCMESFSVSTVEVKIWQIFMFYKANWDPGINRMEINNMLNQ